LIEESELPGPETQYKRSQTEKEDEKGQRTKKKESERDGVGKNVNFQTTTVNCKENKTNNSEKLTYVVKN